MFALTQGAILGLSGVWSRVVEAEAHHCAFQSGNTLLLCVCVPAEPHRP